MHIGNIAAASGIPVDTIRFYEREGLISAPARSASNYRVYVAAHLRELAFIKHCRALDMDLSEIRKLRHVQLSPSETCEEVNLLLDEHIEAVRRRLSDLMNLDCELRALRGLCDAGRTAQRCGILTELSREPPAQTKKRRAGGIRALRRSG